MASRKGPYLARSDVMNRFLLFPDYKKIVVVGFLIDIPLLAPYLRFKRVSLFEWYNLLSLEF